MAGSPKEKDQPQDEVLRDEILAQLSCTFSNILQQEGHSIPVHCQYAIPVLLWLSSRKVAKRWSAESLPGWWQRPTSVLKEMQKTSWILKHVIFFSRKLTSDVILEYPWCNLTLVGHSHNMSQYVSESKYLGYLGGGGFGGYGDYGDFGDYGGYGAYGCYGGYGACGMVPFRLNGWRKTYSAVPPKRSWLLIILQSLTISKNRRLKDAL